MAGQIAEQIAVVIRESAILMKLATVDIEEGLSSYF